MLTYLVACSCHSALNLGCWDGSQAFLVAGPAASFQDSCPQGLEAEILNASFVNKQEPSKMHTDVNRQQSLPFIAGLNSSS